MSTMVPTLSSFKMVSIAGDNSPVESKTVSGAVSSDIETPNRDSDEFLLIAVGNSQDTQAFEQLFSRFATRIYAMGVKLTRNEQLANDLVQEAMLTVWQKAPLYDLDRGSAQSWIFTLTRNRCFDILRKMKRQPSTVNADDIWPAEGEADSELAHEEQGSIEAEVEKIQRYYDQLPAPQRAVVEQIYIHDRTHEEAATELNIPLGTLKSRLRLGMGKLRQMLGTDNNDEIMNRIE